MLSHHASFQAPRPSRRRVSFSPEGGISRMPGNGNVTPFGPRRWKRTVVPKELPSLREGSAENAAGQGIETPTVDTDTDLELSAGCGYIVTPAFHYGPPMYHDLSESSAAFDPDSDDLLEMMKHSLHLATKASSITSRGDGSSKVRDTSSSYGSKEDDLVRIKSPASPPGQNTLDEPNISRYSETNDRLSNLHSSPRESPPCSSMHDAAKDAAKDAAAAANQWQSEPRPKNITYNQLELGNSGEEEVLPSDSVSQCHTPPGLVKRCPRCQCSNQDVSRNIHAIKGQYDGGADTSGFESPQFGTKLHPMNFHDKFSQKRKSSLISLKSISSQIPKKAKRLKVFANDVIQEGTVQLNKLKSKLKKQNEHNRSNFEAWKANRRRARPGDPLKGKPQPSYAMFNFERSVHGGQGEWWKEGVRRYRAPSWMVFGSGTQATT